MDGIQPAHQRAERHARPPAIAVIRRAPRQTLYYLYVTDREERLPAQAIANSFADWKLLAVIDIERRGLPLRTLRIFACIDYQTLPL